MADKKIFFKKVSPLLLALIFFINSNPALAEQYISDNSLRQDTLKNQKQQGNLSVGEFTGATVYDYPLTLPAGRNGLTPSLSLTHNSQDTNLHNQVGYKWSMTEFSIKHLNKNGVDKFYDQNGNIGLNQFTATTPISSGELTSVELMDNHHGLYAEKYESSFAKYEYTPDGYWFMTDKNGIRYTFGKSPEARQFDLNDPTRVYQWMLEEIRDKNENFIRYTYQKFDNQIYPKSIHYTGHGQEDGLFEVKFLIDAQTKRKDAKYSYATGFLVTTNYIVNGIEIYLGDKLQRKYDLAYGTVNPLIRKTLTSITETGYDDEQKAIALPPTTFEYSPSLIEWEETQLYNKNVLPFTTCKDGICQSHKKAFFWDMTGDGLVDIPSNDGDAHFFKNDSKGGWIYQAMGVNHYIPNGDFPNVNWKVLDMDGDGRNDYLRSNFDANNKTQVKSILGLNKEKNVEYSDTVKVSMRGESNNLSFADNGASIGDLNGDGLPDLIQRRSKIDLPETKATCLNQNGTACTATTLWNSPKVIISDNGNKQNPRTTYVEDCNEDGLADISYFADGQQKGILNDGKGGWVNPAPGQICEFSTTDGMFYRSVDLNGDGLMDHVNAHIEVGNNFDKIENQLRLNTGEEELLYDVGDFPLLFGRGNGNGQTETDQTGIRIMDVNGDQLPDVMQRLIVSKTVGNNVINDVQMHVFLHKGSRPYFLKTVNTSQGSTIKLDYKTSAQYLKVDQTQANPKLPIIVDTVSKVTVDDGFGNLSTTDYLYQDGHYHFENASEKAFAGFGTVTKTDTLGYKTKTSYHQGQFSIDHTVMGEYQDHASKIGRPYLTEVYDQNNTLRSRTISRFEHKVLGPNHIFPYLSQNLSQMMDEGVTTSTAQGFSYDAWGNQTEVIDYGQVTANGTNGDFTDLGTELLKTIVSIIAQTAYPFENKTFDQNNKLIAHQRQFYDNLALGQMNKGNATAQESWLDTKNQWVRSETNFDVYGLPLSTKNPRGFMSYVEYDAYNLYPKLLTNTKGHKTQVTYDPALGQMKLMKDANGMTAKTVYDPFGRPKEQYQDGVMMNAISYDDNVMPRKVSSTIYNDDGETVEEYIYLDGLGRTVESKKEASDGKWATTQTIYDERGNVKKQIQPYFSASKDFEALNEAQVGTQMTYDVFSRPLSVITPLGTTTSVYKGLETTVTDAMGHVKRFKHDVRKNLRQVDEKNEGETYQTLYEYDALGRLTKTMDAQNNSRIFGYDSLGRRVMMSKFNTKDSWSYDYDLNGNLTKKTDPKGQVALFAYDALDRVLSEQQEGQAVDMSYIYDIGEDAIGRLARVVGKNYNHDLIYDPWGRVSREVKGIEAKSFKFEYGYDQMGALKSIQYPDETVVKYDYDSAHQLEEVRGEDTSYAQGFTYSPLGQLEEMSLGKMVMVTNEYDPAKLYQLKSKKSFKEKTMLQDYAYSFDAIGNVTQLVDNNMGLTAKVVEYQYDDLSRLKEAQFMKTAEGEDFTEKFTYDAIGNMTSKWDVGEYLYDLPSEPHAVTKAGEKEYGYEENGNMILRDGVEMGYDYKDRLLHSGKDAMFTYGEGYDRIMKFNAETEEKTYYPSQYFEVDGSKETKYIYAGNQRIAKVEKPVKKDTSPKLFYLLTDHLDSIDTVLDESGDVVERQDYFSFGAERVTDTTAEAPVTNQGYTGKEKDEETGLNYYGARYYDSELGRFVTVDPWEGDLSDPQTLNKFTYVLNNPLKYVDPTGMYDIKAGKVEEGDTMGGINDELNEFYGTNYSVEDLAKINGIADPNKIEVGQRVRIGTLTGWTIPDDPDIVNMEYWNSLNGFQQYLVHYSRNLYQPIPPGTTGDLDSNEWQYVGMSLAHNMFGASGNIDYRGIGIRMGQQAIYDKNGKLVMTAENKGTYDFSAPTSDALIHTVLDVEPWIRWGNSPTDSTTREQRVAALAKTVTGRAALTYISYLNRD